MSRGLAALWALALGGCGSRAGLEDPADGGMDAPAALDLGSERVPVDRSLVRPDVVLRSCDGGPLPTPRPGARESVPGRFGLSAVFDRGARRIYAVGGSASGGTRAAAPFAVDVDTGRVTPLRLEGVAMLPIGAAAVWDAPRSRAVLVGGRYPDGGFFTAGRAVLEVRVAGDIARATALPDYPVGGVSGHALAVDPEREELVVTGGGNDSAPATSAYRATWALSLRPGGRWARRAQEADGPAAGEGRAMGWDPELRRLVLAGGYLDRARDRRAWVLEGSRWRQVPGTLDAIPGGVTGLQWDPRSCGFVMPVGNCSAELWLLRVRDLPSTALLGRFTREAGAGPNGPAVFLDEATDRLLFLGGESCQTSGFVYAHFEAISLAR
ncbi:MAG: hypothetical protein HY909_15625 [Deltaproteobacteria bacterium]|nr:hypothetical protein [Deltaproteobacteria bacterium]